jgi:hypothetical protein
VAHALLARVAGPRAAVGTVARPPRHLRIGGGWTGLNGRAARLNGLNGWVAGRGWARLVGLGGGVAGRGWARLVGLGGGVAGRGWTGLVGLGGGVGAAGEAGQPRFTPGVFSFGRETVRVVVQTGPDRVLLHLERVGRCG